MVGKLALLAALSLMLVLGGFTVMLGVMGGAVSNAACSTAQLVGATEYGGPGDPSSGDVGSSGLNLYSHPDSYAELGGTSFETADALGGLEYGTPLMISWHGHQIVAYKRDIGLGGGPIDGHRRVIDLWWELAKRLGIPYENGEWSGLIRISQEGTGCLGASAHIVPGARARIGAGDRAEIPRNVPAAVKGILEAGNQIVGKPYVYGGGHGIALNLIAPNYDCSSSVAHLLWGGGLLPADTDMDSTEFMTWGKPGPGKWVTIWASPVHVFMYVDGIRWDTHNEAGPDDGPAGIGWHPLIREHDGFVERHPAGL
jgi:hypothetical protein